MPSIYPDKVNVLTLESLKQAHNSLIDRLNKDLSSAIIGGGVGDVYSPTSGTSTDGFVVLFDGITGKLIKNSLIDGAWFNQSVTSLASPTFAGATITRLGVGHAPDTNIPLILKATSDSYKLFSMEKADSTEIASLTSTNLTVPAINELTLAKQTIGFTIAGGTTSKTLTVPLDASVSGTNTGDQTLPGVGDFDIKDLADTTSLRSTWSGKQNALTFGISDTNAVRIDSATVANGEFAKFTANGLESRSTAEVLSDIGAQAAGTYLTSANIDDTAYGAGWDNDTTHAPTKNAVYDKINALPGGHDAVTINATANGLSVDASQVLTLGLASTSTTGALSDTDWDTFNGKQSALTFGIADTNKVQINAADVADNDYAKFTATGLEGRSYTEVLSDIGAQASGNELTALQALADTAGFVKKTGDGAYEIKTNAQTLSDISAQGAGTTTPNDGWIVGGDTWEYVSATSFRINADYTALIQKGDRVKWTQTTVKYYNVLSVSAYTGGYTTMTTTGGTDYTVANAAITSPCFSHVENPIGFPHWFNYTPTWTASPTNPAIGNGINLGKFRICGKSCEFSISMIMGSTTTYGSGGWYHALPVQVAIETGRIWIAPFFLGDYNWGLRFGLGYQFISGVTAIQSICHGTGTPTNATAPNTWESGDTLAAQGIYQF